MEVLVQEVIKNYLHDFVLGNTYNYFLRPIAYEVSDTWISDLIWSEKAKNAYEMRTNINQSLEILLHTDFKDFFVHAEKFVADWDKYDGHDAYYYYDILAKFPKTHVLRQKYLLESDYPDYMVNDGWGYSNSAREALIFSGDKQFLSYTREWVDNKLIGATENIIEDEIILIVKSLGKQAQFVLSDKSLLTIKQFCSRYLEKDKLMTEKKLDGYVPHEDERSLWLLDDIGYLCWCLDWHEMVDKLNNSDWYWAIMFSEDWMDYENNSLLGLSSMTNNPILLNRANQLLNNGHIDGAIAKSRLSLKLKQKNQR